MSWTNKTMKLAAAALAVGIAGTALAGTIVIRADGPSKGSYPPGKSLTGRVALRAGDTLVVLDGRGTRTLTGPASIDLSATRTASAAPSALTSLIRNAGARQVRTGAVRGGTTVEANSPNLWYIDTTRSGTVCIADRSQATLWRKSMTNAVTLTLTRGSDHKAVPLTFAVGQSVRSWPVSDMPITTSSDYWLSGPGIAKPVSVRIETVGNPGTTPDTIAAALIEKGCSHQVDMLVAAGS
ncbi:hypothetical protein D3Y57_17975 [Sphingomonas paeninsulae]|jgi:hypothetical protein|uniref:Uncharacterized protein n=1 Tax=Sphingomonas paeninsulae TaxID=2319844 RepID=A0A494TPS5_SPHPE|nr:hypothetical protein [Sphingomonas paeninsulae]AYJ87468.1 hypothetical protein D3Y57_17975 [Sphingomonas paeninsulae]